MKNAYARADLEWLRDENQRRARFLRCTKAKLVTAPVIPTIITPQNDHITCTPETCTVPHAHHRDRMSFLLDSMPKAPSRPLPSRPRSASASSALSISSDVTLSTTSSSSSPTPPQHPSYLAMAQPMGTHDTFSSSLSSSPPGHAVLTPSYNSISYQKATSSSIPASGMPVNTKLYDSSDMPSISLDIDDAASIS